MGLLLVSKAEPLPETFLWINNNRGLGTMSPRLAESLPFPPHLTHEVIMMSY